ncbi:MAG: DUF4339 domain-containing protein [Planctomycetaceae bacterium]|nr:DUF4339 domain-containing protein [Planctomycetaceae bacterium]
MASQYYYQFDAETHGPVAFQELIHLVRDERLNADSLVRDDWQEEWIPAAKVVGLFHMAGRPDLLAKWEAEQRRKQAEALAAESTSFSTDDLDDLLNTAASLPDETSPPDWQRRLEEVGRSASVGMGDSDTGATDQPSALGRLIDEIEEAAAEQEPRRPGLLQTLFQSLTLSRLFRWGLAILVANLTGAALIAWTRRELLRFPSPLIKLQGGYVFPFWGPCTIQEYGFLLIDSMLLAGLIAYGLAMLLESMTSDERA